MCLDRSGIERVPEVMSAGLCVLDHNKVKSDFEEGKVLDLCTGKKPHLQQIILLRIFVLLSSET